MPRKEARSLQSLRVEAFPMPRALAIVVICQLAVKLKVANEPDYQSNTSQS